MNPLSGPVIGGSLLMSGPAWWAVFVDETLSAEVAVQRWLLCLLAVWAALSLVKAMSEKALETSRPARATAVPAAPADVVGVAFAPAPGAGQSTAPAQPRDLAAEVSPDVAAGVLQQMSPDMGTARRLGDESPEPED